MLCGIAEAGSVLLMGFFENEKGGNSSPRAFFEGSAIYQIWVGEFWSQGVDFG